VTTFKLLHKVGEGRVVGPNPRYTRTHGEEEKGQAISGCRGRQGAGARARWHAPADPGRPDRKKRKREKHKPTLGKLMDET